MNGVLSQGGGPEGGHGGGGGRDNMAFDGNLDPPVVNVPEPDNEALAAVIEEAIEDHAIATYLYQPDMSLRRMTIWDLPHEKHYDTNILEKFKRPTLDDLMKGITKNGGEDGGVPKGLGEEGGEDADGEDKAKEGKVVKFGWMEGVLMRCLLCIWGVMLFLRLSWVIGQAGIIEGLLLITLANVITLITALSMSAVATNGRISGGGVYYLISRSLGPELGGAIGLMFTLANAISVATYTIGFCDNILDLVYDQAPMFHGIVDPDCKVSDCRLNDLRILGTPIIILILVLAIVGMDWVTRVDKFLLVVLLLAQIDMFAGSLVKGGNLYVTEEERFSKGFTSWNIETAKLNVYSRYGENGLKEESFMSIFGVFFTAVTGITAGANLSGDLKDPSEAIPKGTLIAILWTYISYGFFGIMLCFSYLPMASGDVYEWRNESNTSLAFDDCSLEAQEIRGGPCEYGAAIDQKTIMYISYTGYLVFFGCYAATLSSAIASFVGAPRVLQAVGKDGLYPFISFFGKGSGANNDPVRGYFLIFAISFGCLMIASLNAIGSLASNFFLAAYALINFSVFHSSMTKSPGWRPSFKYYNKWLSLLGTILAVGAMFAMEWRLALATMAIIAVLYGVMLYLKPEISWGSSAEALKFVNALNNAQVLNDVPDHAKTYRPKILLLSGNPAHRKPLVDFANLLTKKLSLMIAAQILDDDKTVDLEVLNKTVSLWLKEHKITSFFTAAKNNNYCTAVKNCISLCGLGKLKPNMVLMGYKADKTSMKAIEEYVEIMIFTLEQNLSLGILRLQNGTDYSAYIAKEETVVIDPIIEEGSETLTSELTDPEVEVTRSRRFANFPRRLPKVPTVKRPQDRRLSLFKGADGLPLSPLIVKEIEQFKVKQRRGNIDVWWLYDDGGLTLLLPYILQTRKQFAGCKLRVFALSTNHAALDSESANFASLLRKFRIDASEVIVVPGLGTGAPPKPATRDEFERVLAEFPKNSISQSDIASNRERTDRNLRLTEMLRDHSGRSELVVITLPLPRRNQFSPGLYMAWLEMITKNMPPVLLTRGNQSSVLTFYS